MLKQRILSALILLPLPILAMYFETPWFEVLIACIITIMGWEWEKLVLKRFSVYGMIMASAGIISIFVLDYIPIFALILPILMMFVFYYLCNKNNLPHKKLYSFGMIYTAYPAVSMVYILHNGGFLDMFWLFGLVCLVDTGAYIFGKTIGGPKLCPKISPKKTWAGFFGGIVCAALWGYLFTYLTSQEFNLFSAILAGVLGAVSQFGDLFESAIKRFLNVKDSSNLIPGHGGIFDRLDALMFVSPFVVLLEIFFASFVMLGVD